MIVNTQCLQCFHSLFSFLKHKIYVKGFQNKTPRIPPHEPGLRPPPRPLWSLHIHRAQVHIRGYGSVHTGGAVFEARKRRKVDLINFDMVIKIKVVKFECTTEHSNISSYCYSFHTW